MRTPTATVGDLAVRDVVTVSAQASLIDCAKLMRGEHVGSLIVIGDDRKPIGIVTDRDIVVEALATELDTRTLTAGDVMSHPLAVVRDSDDILDALARMREHGVRRLPVLNAGGELVGVVAVDNLLESIAEQVDSIVRVMKAERTREGATRR